MKQNLKSRHHQRGVVLAVGLILLLVMTLVMIAAMSGSILQERMAGAVRSESMADIGADSALREGELWIWRQVEARATQLGVEGGSYPYAAGSAEASLFRTGQAFTGGGTAYGSPSGIDYPVTDYYRMANTPEYFIEALGEVGIDENVPESHTGSSNTLNEAVHYYRITGRSTGGTESVSRAAESTFSISIFQD